MSRGIKIFSKIALEELEEYNRTLEEKVEYLMNEVESLHKKDKENFKSLKKSLNTVVQKFNNKNSIINTDLRNIKKSFSSNIQWEFTGLSLIFIGLIIMLYY